MRNTGPKAWMLALCLGVGLGGSAAPHQPRLPSAVEVEVARPHESTREAMRHIEHLAGKIGPRKAGSDAERRAAKYIAAVMQGNGYQAKLQEGIPIRGRTGATANVVAKSPMHRGSRAIIVGAHYDSMVGRAASPGANDNATGVAVLLEAARLLKSTPLGYEVQFVFFGGEEVHHEGSRWFVANQERGPQCPRAGHQAPRTAGTVTEAGSRTRGMIAVDMIGVGERLWLNYAAGSNEVGERLRQAAQTIDVEVSEKGDNPHSDHEAFARAGIPAVWIQRLPDAANHSADDRVDRIRPEYVQDVIDLLCTCLLQMGREPPQDKVT